MGRDNFDGEKGRLIVKYRVTNVVICAKTAEPIEMPFGLWVRMGRRNYVLGGGPALLRYVAMAMTLRHSISAMSSSDSLTPKTHP